MYISGMTFCLVFSFFLPDPRANLLSLEPESSVLLVEKLVAKSFKYSCLVRCAIVRNFSDLCAAFSALITETGNNWEKNHIGFHAVRKMYTRYMTKMSSIDLKTI